MIAPKLREPRQAMMASRRLNENVREDPQTAALSLMPVVVSTSRALVIEALSREYIRIDALTAHNNSGSTADTLTLNIIPDGGSASTSNRVYETSIAANATVSLDALENITIDPGAAVSVVAANGTIVLAGGLTRIFTGFSR